MLWIILGVAWFIMGFFGWALAEGHLNPTPSKYLGSFPWSFFCVCILVGIGSLVAGIMLGWGDWSLTCRLWSKRKTDGWLMLKKLEE